MYTKPTLRQYGSFRALTQIGSDQDGDGGIIWGIGDGCNVIATDGCNRS